MLTHRLKQHRIALIKLGLHRTRQVHPTDERVINFSSNDYLSLTDDPRIKKAYQDGLNHHPVGSGGSMLVCGYHAAHKAVEAAFSEALGVDDCLLFSSGYAANLSVIALLAQFNAHILIDKGVHASIYDGLRLSQASYSRYLHQNVSDLALKNKKLPETTVILTEGTFSMSGQSAPLREMAQVGRPLIVDEAHAFGVLGQEGLGSVVQHQLTQAEVPLRIIPLGKAFAASGAIVAGHTLWVDALLQSARPYIYSTAISPAFSHGLLETLKIIRAADDRREKLRDLVQYFRQAIKGSPLTWADSASPIQQLQLGCSHLALQYADKLREHDIICTAMRKPTVSQQETGLRIILNYAHQPAHIDSLLNCLYQ